MGVGVGVGLLGGVGAIGRFLLDGAIAGRLGSGFPYGTLAVNLSVVMIKQTTPLEPKALEYSYHARGVGLVLTLAVSGGSDRVELVRYTPGK